MKNLLVSSAAGVLMFTLLAQAQDKPATASGADQSKSVLTGPTPPAPPGDSRGFSGKRQGGRGNPILNAVREMDLPAETHDKIIAIFAEQEAQNRKMREESEPKRKDLEEKMRAARESNDQEALRKLGEEMRPFFGGRTDPGQNLEKVNALLTPDQQAKLKEILDKQPRPQGFGGQMGRGPGGPGGPGGPRGPGFDPRQLFESLALAEDQQAKAREIMQAYGEQLRGFLQSNGDKMQIAAQRMNQAREKQDEAAMEQARDQIRELQKFAPPFPFEKIQALLSAEQQEKFKPLADRIKQEIARRAEGRFMGGPGGPGGPPGPRPEGGRRPGSPGSPGSEGAKSKLEL